MVLYEIYSEDGGNGITFVHMLYIKFVETLREDFFKGIKLLKKQITEKTNCIQKSIKIKKKNILDVGQF